MEESSKSNDSDETDKSWKYFPFTMVTGMVTVRALSWSISLWWKPLGLGQQDRKIRECLSNRILAGQVLPKDFYLSQAVVQCVKHFEQFLFAEQFKCGAVSDCVEIEAAQSGLSYLFIAFKSNSLTFAIINLSFILPLFKSVFFLHLNLISTF